MIRNLPNQQPLTCRICSLIQIIPSGSDLVLCTGTQCVASRIRSKDEDPTGLLTDREYPGIREVADGIYS